ncbi:MAG TPA: hypothetical protein VKN99_07320 [Polyangia bacterium]|nr:hypothetical protein [Polyangia bacterium]
MRAIMLALVVLSGCTDERVLVLKRVPLACGGPIPATQVQVGAEGDFPPVVVSQPPDTPISIAGFPQDLRVLTVRGLSGGMEALIGRTGVIDLAQAPGSLPIAYGPPGRYCVTGTMSAPRSGHAAVKMRDGRVLVAGGGMQSIEIYDPQAAAWSGYDSLQFPAAAYAATLLDDGRVMIVGGQGAQLVDASGRLQRPALFLRGPIRASAPVLVRLADGNLLVAGGGAEASVIYDRRLGDFVDGPHVAPRNGGHGFLLANGHVLLVGGSAPAPPAEVLADFGSAGSGALLDGETAFPVAWAPLPTGAFLGVHGSMHDLMLRSDGTWFALAGPPSARTTGAQATALADDLVLVTGGDATAAADLFLAARGALVSAGQLPLSAHQGASATLLDDGTVLFAGGENAPAAPSANAVVYFHNLVSSYSTSKVLTFDTDEPTVIPFDPTQARRVGGGYVLDAGNRALLGGMRFRAVTVRLAFVSMPGDLDVIIGYENELSYDVVRFPAAGGATQLVRAGVVLCTGAAAPPGGFVTVDVRAGQVSARAQDGGRLLDCTPMPALPERFAIGVGAENGPVSVDNIEVTR